VRDEFWAIIERKRMTLFKAGREKGGGVIGKVFAIDIRYI
jgi:hypothetical protein